MDHDREMDNAIHANHIVYRESNIAFSRCPCNAIQKCSPVMYIDCLNAGNFPRLSGRSIACQVPK